MHAEAWNFAVLPVDLFALIHQVEDVATRRAEKIRSETIREYDAALVKDF
jgi:hypothetical protein